MKIETTEWDKEENEFYILPLLSAAKSNKIITINIGWLLWAFSFQFRY